MLALDAVNRRSLLEMLTDEEVVQRVLAGEAALFEILMRRYNQRLYRAVRSILPGDEDEIENVMQQAYVNAYTHLLQFAGQARFSTWLTRIAVHEALARRRRQGFTVTEAACGEPCEEKMSNLQSATLDPEAQSFQAELRTALEAEIGALPENYRAVFVLREVEALSTEETAECLQVNEDVVKTRLHRARTMLRDALFLRAGLSVQSLFPFHDRRCDRVVARVFAAVSNPAA
jgi:RNA polymerase sigma-70 factor, ECF subfamily